MSKEQGPRVAGMRLTAIVAGRRQRQFEHRDTGAEAAPA